MITGVDYVIYSTNSIFDIIDSFCCCLKERWSSFVVEEFDVEAEKRLELFFAKDKKMNRFHDKNGYALDTNGEGCFMLMGEAKDVLSIAITVKEQVHYKGFGATEAYDSKLIGSNIWEYTLVLPDIIEENSFCKYIMDSLVKSIEDSAKENVE